jgi:hypothetical protein
MYSPTGNSLEGMQTPEYSATVGKLDPFLLLMQVLYDHC